MRIFMFIFVGIALGDKLDRTYLPPPGSKFAGGSPGSLQTPLEFPKETYPTSGSIGQVAPTFEPNQRPGNPQGIVGDGFVRPMQGEQLPNQQGLSPNGQLEFGNRLQQESERQRFTPTGQPVSISNQIPGRQGFGSTQPPFGNQQKQEYGRNEFDPTGQRGQQVFIPTSQPIFGNKLMPESGQQGFTPTAPATFSSNRLQPIFGPKGLTPTEFQGDVTSIFESNQVKQLPGASGFGPTDTSAPNIQPTFGQNQGNINSQPGLQNFAPAVTQRPIKGQSFGTYQVQQSPQGNTQLSQQRPNIEQGYIENQGQSQFDSNGFRQPDKLPNFQQSPIVPSSESPLNNFQNNVPLTTTSYVFTQTTVSPFDETPGTVPSFALNGQRPFDMTVQLNYPQNGIPSNQRPVSQQGQTVGENNKPLYSQGISGSNQIGLNDFEQGQAGDTQSYNYRPSSSQEVTGQNKEMSALNQPSFYRPQEVQIQQPQQKSDQQRPSGPQDQFYPGSEFQSGDQIKSYQPTRVPGSPASQQTSKLELVPQFGGQSNTVKPSLFPESQIQNQFQSFNNNGRPTQQITPGNQYSTTVLPSQQFPQRADQYQNGNGPVSSTTISPFDQIYSLPGNQATGAAIENQTNRPDYSTPGFQPQPTPGSFVSSTASSITPSIYSPTTPAYPGDDTQQVLRQKMPERIQADTDRNAVILSYENNLTPEGEFMYSFDTSNGIHADENGTSIDGVKAQGSFSYTGDDGKVYTVTYSADENGFVPMGDHLPTSPPIPEAIKRVIEQAMRDKEAGISNDGSYDEAKYGYKKYKGKMDRYKPMINYDGKQNKIKASSKEANSEEDKFITKTDIKNEDLDYETLEAEIDDIKTLNGKAKNDLISNFTDTTQDTKFIDKTRNNVSEKAPKRSQLIKSDMRKNEDPDDGYESDDEETVIKRPKSDQRRPISTSTEDKIDENEDFETEIPSKTPKIIKSTRRPPSNKFTQTSEDKRIENNYDDNDDDDHDDDNIGTKPKSNRRRPNNNYSSTKGEEISEKGRPVIGVNEEENFDEENFDSVSEDNFDVKTTNVPRRPKPTDRKQTSTTLSKRPESYSYGDKNDNKTKRLQSSNANRQRPNLGETSTRDNIYDEFETEIPSQRPQSPKSNRRKPRPKVSKLPGKGDTDDDGDDYEAEITSKQPFDRRRPGFQVPETDDDIYDEDFEEKKTTKRPNANRKRPGNTLQVIKNQSEDNENYFKMPSRRPLPPKNSNEFNAFDQSVEDGSDYDSEEKQPTKPPQSKNERPNATEASDYDSETDYKTKKPSSKIPGSYRRRPSIAGDTNKFGSRKPANNRPGITKQPLDNDAERESESYKSAEDNVNIVRPINEVFGYQNPDKQFDKPSDNFEAPEKEDDYDYALNERTDDATKTKSATKFRDQQSQDPSGTSFGEETEDEEFISQDDLPNNKSFTQKSRKPSSYKTTFTKDETIIENDDTTGGFEQSTPSSNRLFPYSTKKPFIKDGNKGYNYLPPLNRFNEAPERIPYGQDGEESLANKPGYEKNQVKDFQSQFSTTGPQSTFKGQPIASRPNIQENEPSSTFSPSKIQTLYETGSTGRPFNDQQSQNTSSPYTPKYPVTERNKYQTPGSTPGSFMPSQTPGATYGPTQSTPENVYGDRYSTTAKPFGPNQLGNAEMRPTYLPSSERPFENEKLSQQNYPSGKIPSTTYRPSYSTNIMPNYGPAFGSSRQEYEQNQLASQRPIYGPGSTTSNRNIYPTEGPNNILSNNPNVYSQGSTAPNRFSSTELPKQGFGSPTFLDGQGDGSNGSGFGPQRFGSSTIRPKGEDFSGPRRPQTYDPETGYHYK